MNVRSKRSAAPVTRAARARGTVREDALLDAALPLFAQRGFHGVAVPEIAATARVSTGSLYRLFPSKEALVNALYRRWKGALASFLGRELTADAPARALFGALWSGLGRFAREHPGAFVFLELHHHADYLDGSSRALEEATLRPIVTLLERAMEAGRVRRMTPAALIAMVWGAMLGLIKAAELDYLRLTPEVLAETEEALWLAIAPAPRRRR
jgi:TetR/AcrR family transcriptional regulator, repressor of fatR-cypB operon